MRRSPILVVGYHCAIWRHIIVRYRIGILLHVGEVGLISLLQALVGSLLAQSEAALATFRPASYSPHVHFKPVSRLAMAA